MGVAPPSADARSQEEQDVGRRSWRLGQFVVEGNGLVWRRFVRREHDPGHQLGARRCTSNVVVGLAVEGIRDGREVLRAANVAASLSNTGPVAQHQRLQLGMVF